MYIYIYICIYIFINLYLLGHSSASRMWKCLQNLNSMSAKIPNASANIPVMAVRLQIRALQPHERIPMHVGIQGPCSHSRNMFALQEHVCIPNIFYIDTYYNNISCFGSLASITFIVLLILGISTINNLSIFVY